ncbi:MAG TPA: J domain-containing protein [Polyangiaceae bacterium]|nr:J domain-containing protein [Polyangiaceae bacterium]
MRNPYEVLGVPRDASPDELKAAFRRLAARHHPDRNPGDAEAQHRFKEVNAAYQLLSDPQKRAMFDRFGSAEGPFGRGGAQPFDFSSFSQGIPLDGLFGDLLERLGLKQTDRGDLRRELWVSLEEAAAGAEKELTYERTEICGDCKGGGSRDGAPSRVCPQCAGRGRVRGPQGLLPLVVERECARCQGRGRLVTDPCHTCRGAGLVTKERTIVVTVPPGVEDNTSRLVERGGNVPRADRGPGDLELVLRVKPHPVFKRSGDDVVCSVAITFAQACLGGEVHVPTLDGKGKLRIPPATQPGAVLRIKSKGLPKRVTGGRGDQLVEVRVEVPQTLSPRGRELVEALAEELGEAVQQPPPKTFVEKLKDLFG